MIPARGGTPAPAAEQEANAAGMFGENHEHHSGGE